MLTPATRILRQNKLQFKRACFEDKKFWEHTFCPFRQSMSSIMADAKRLCDYSFESLESEWNKNPIDLGN